MTARFDSPEDHLSHMRAACLIAVEGPTVDSSVTLAALTYRRLLSGGSSAEETVQQVKSAVAAMRLDAHALPSGSPEKALREMITDVGQAILDGDVTSLLVR